MALVHQHRAVSWAATEHVDEGRRAVNYSEFTTGGDHEAEETIEVILEDSMPPYYYTLFGLHPEADLSQDEIDRAGAGLRATPGLTENEGETEKKTTTTNPASAIAVTTPKSHPLPTIHRKPPAHRATLQLGPRSLGERSGVCCDVYLSALQVGRPQGPARRSTPPCQSEGHHHAKTRSCYLP